MVQKLEIMSENKYDVQRYRWDQTLRLGKTIRASGTKLSS